MANTTTIILKHSGTSGNVPDANNLQYGEIAINYSDGKLFYKKSDNQILEISGAAGTANTANSGFLQANAAYDQANTARTHANAAHLTANAAFVQANTARTHANAAFVQANTARTHANAAHLTANAAFVQANTARNHANAAFLVANSAFDFANTKFSANGGTISGSVEIDGSLSISGNLNVLGNVTSFNTIAVSINDPLILLANNNTSDLIDIGFSAHYANATNEQVHTGFFRDHQTKEWFLFKEYNVHFLHEHESGHIDPSGNNFTIDVLNATLRSSNIIFNGSNLQNWLDSIYIHANSGYITANAAYDQANTARNFSNAGFVQANTARDHANAGFAQANTARDHANASYDQANTARTYANAGFEQANTARIHANVGFEQANTARDYANAAFVQANTARDHSNVGFEQANTARDYANAAHLTANAGFDKANSANVVASAAFNKANSVTQNGFVTIVANGVSLIADSNNDTLTIRTTGNVAITADSAGDNLTFDLTATGVTPSTYGSNTVIPVFVVDSRGRLTSVSNTNIDNTIASAAFNQANNAFSNAVLKTGNTMTGPLVMAVGVGSGSSNTGSIVVQGGVGVSGNVYISNSSSYGFSNTSNVSVARIQYNSACNSIDFIFG